MVRPINVLLSLFVLSWLASCNVEQEPRTEFTTPFKRHKIDLSYRLGNAFSVLRGKDTVVYNIHYKRKTRINYILKGAKDTILTALR